MADPRLGQSKGRIVAKDNGKGRLPHSVRTDDSLPNVTYSDLSDNTKLVIVTGDISRKNLDSLETRLASALGLKEEPSRASAKVYKNNEPQYQRFVLDFSDVSSVSSATVGALYYLFGFKYDSKDASVNKNVKFVLSDNALGTAALLIHGMDGIFEFYKTTGEAKLGFDLDLVINAREMTIGDIRTSTRRIGPDDRRNDQKRVLDEAVIKNSRTGDERRLGKPRRSGFDRRELEDYRGRYINKDESIQVRNGQEDPVLSLDDSVYLATAEEKIPEAKRLYLGITNPNPTTRAIALIEMAKAYMVGDIVKNRLYRKTRLMLEWKAYDPDKKVRNYAKLLLGLTAVKKKDEQDDSRAIETRKTSMDKLMASKLVTKQPGLVRELLEWKTETDGYEQVRAYATKKLSELPK